MKIQAISGQTFNGVQSKGVTQQKETAKGMPESAPSSLAKVPLIALIAMSPLNASGTVNIDNDKALTPEKVVLSADRDTTRLIPDEKVLDVKTFYDVNGRNYIVKTRSFDGDDSNFECVTISDATPNSKELLMEACEVVNCHYLPIDDAFSDMQEVNVGGIRVNALPYLIGDEKFVEYFQTLANSPDNHGAIFNNDYYEILGSKESGIMKSSAAGVGNCWDDAVAYQPEGKYMGEKAFAGEHGDYVISIYGSDKNKLSADEFTLKKEHLPEMKIDKMVKVKANFAMDKKAPVTFETYQFNLKDDNGDTTIIYDKKLGEYMEKVCKSALYNQEEKPFAKSEIERNYKISAEDRVVYADKR